MPFQLDLMTGFNARYGADLVGFSVVRTRGIIRCDSDVVGTPVVVAARVGAEGEVASTEYNPMTNGEYLDWFLYEPFLCSGTGVDDSDVTARVIDVKSARKLDELDQTVFLYAGSDTAAAATVNLRFNLSMLLMQP